MEGALLIAAFGLARLLGVPLLPTLRWSATDALLGVAASVPLLALFFWLMRSAWRPVCCLVRFLEEVVRPIITGWSLWQMAVISALAGTSEEVLFRGVLQGGLTLHCAAGLALLAASLMFGLAHCVNATYAFVAAAMGAGLGALWLWTGNLLVPMVAHTTYDFVALVYLARFSARRPPAQGTHREPDSPSHSSPTAIGGRCPPPIGPAAQR